MEPVIIHANDGKFYIKYNGIIYEVDEDGFLFYAERETTFVFKPYPLIKILHPVREFVINKKWNTNWVKYIQSIENIPFITNEHQKIIDVLQEYYIKNGIAPMVRILSKNTGLSLKRIYELFPSGPARGACRMAGVPKPIGCV